MYIYKLEQDERRGEKVYRKAIVIASSPEKAVNIHPDSWLYDTEGWNTTNWASKPNKVKVTQMGIVTENYEVGWDPCVICFM
jgi:hypothetical protein